MTWWTVSFQYFTCMVYCWTCRRCCRCHPGTREKDTVGSQWPGALHPKGESYCCTVVRRRSDRRGREATRWLSANNVSQSWTTHCPHREQTGGRLQVFLEDTGGNRSGISTTPSWRNRLVYLIYLVGWLVYLFIDYNFRTFSLYYIID